MIAINQMYKRLTQYLLNTRYSLYDACDALGIDYDAVDSYKINLHQCTHCDIWTNKLILDLDDNPICNYCRHLEGM